jgi:Flp pilus assembly protein CpaB
MKTRGFATVLAILLAAVATGAVYLYVKGVKQENRTAAGSAQVLVSKADIPAGTALDPLITQNTFELKSFPGNGLVQGAVTSVEQLRGHSTSSAIIAGEQMTLARLNGTTARTGGILGIKNGFEALTVALDAPHGGGGFVQPGDHVTIYASGSGSQKSNTAITLIPDVRVLNVLSGTATGTTTGGGVQPTSAALQITLEVTPQNAERIIVANTGSGGAGTMWMALLPPGQAGTNPGPVTIGQIFKAAA